MKTHQNKKYTKILVFLTRFMGHKKAEERRHFINLSAFLCLRFVWTFVQIIPYQNETQSDLFVNYAQRSTSYQL